MTNLDDEPVGLDYFLLDMGFSSWVDAMQCDITRKIILARGRAALATDENAETQCAANDLEVQTSSELIWPQWQGTAVADAVSIADTAWTFPAVAPPDIPVQLADHLPHEHHKLRVVWS